MVEQTQVGFVDQRGRLQRLVGLPAPKIRAGQFVELLINLRRKLFQREEYSDVKTNIPLDRKIFSPPVGH